MQPPEESTVPRKLDRITVDPAIMKGQPCIRGMRLTVRRVVEAAALYPDRNELKAEYPGLTDEDIAQALDFAARTLRLIVPSRQLEVSHYRDTPCYYPLKNPK